MEPHSDEEYEKQLEEAIEASLVNYTKSVAKPSNDALCKENGFAGCKSQQVEAEKQMFFKNTDLIDCNDNYTYSINRDVLMECDDDEEQKDNVEEEQKGIVEELSENPPCTDLNNEMFSEYMAILEVNIIDQSELKSILSVLRNCVPALFLLELVGFKRTFEEERLNSYTTQKVDCYMLDYDNFSIKTFECMNELISNKLEELKESSKPTTYKPSTTIEPKADYSNPSWSNKYVPINSKRKQQMEKLMTQQKNNKNMLYELAMQREQRKAEIPEVYNKNPYSVRSIEQQQYDGTESVWDQLKVYRENMRKKEFYRPSKTVTVSDLENMNKSASLNVGPNDIKRLGIRCLELSNNFRKSQGKPELTWNDELYKIAMEHSKNMAEGTVAFGHDGFNERMGKVPFHVRSFSENVAYNYNCGDPCETAVIGWINSPGHRKKFT